MSVSISRVETDPKIADSTRIPLPNKAKWYQTEQAAKITGLALMAIGAVAAAAATVTLIVFAPITFAVALSCAALALAIAAIASGILVYRKECWHDQAFIDKTSQKAQKMSLSGILDKYSIDQIISGHIISREALNKKFVEEVESHKLDLTNISERFSILIMNGLIDETSKASIYEIYKNELIAKKAEFKQSSEKFVNYCEDCKPALRTISEKDTWTKEYVKDLIVDKGYPDIRYIKNSLSSTFHWPILTREIIKSELEAQFEKGGRKFDVFYKRHCQQGNRLSEILGNSYIDIKALRESFDDATQGMGLAAIIETYDLSVCDPYASVRSKFRKTDRGRCWA